MIDARSLCRLLERCEGEGAGPGPSLEGESCNIEVFCEVSVQPPCKSPPNLKMWCGSVVDRWANDTHTCACSSACVEKKHATAVAFALSRKRKSTVHVVALGQIGGRMRCFTKDDK